MSDWTPIAQAPEDPYNADIDIWNGHKRYTNCVWATPDGVDGVHPCWCYCEYERNYGWCLYAVPTPTHWMNPPEPPSEA